MGVGFRGLVVLSTCAAFHLSANATPAQINCDGGLTQTDNGTTDLYLCTGNLTVSNGSLVVTDALNLTAQGSLALVDASIQAKSIALSAHNSVSIDALTTLNTASGANGGKVVISAGSYGPMLGSYMGSTISTSGSLNTGTGSGFVISTGHPFVNNQSSFPGFPPIEVLIAVPEPSSYAVMLMGLAGVGFAAWRNRATKRAAA